jgi:hypothetical protein
MIQRELRSDSQRRFARSHSQVEGFPKIGSDQRETAASRRGLNACCGLDLSNRDRNGRLTIDDGVFAEQDGFPGCR